MSDFRVEGQAGDYSANAGTYGSGVTDGHTYTASGGLPGLFGQTDKYNTYSANTLDTRLSDLRNQRALAEEMYRIRQGGSAGQMQAASATGANVGVAQMDPYAGLNNARQQQQLANILMKQANGQMGTAGQAMIRQSTDANLAAALAQGAAYRGGSAAAGARLAMQNRAAIQQQAGAQMAIQQQQDQLAAQQALGGLVTNARGQDLSMASQNAQMQQQSALQRALFSQEANMANAGFQQQANAANYAGAMQRDEIIQKLMAQGFSLEQARQAAIIQQRQFNASLAAQQEASAHGQDGSKSAAQAQAMGAVLSTAAMAAAAASDERVKTNIEAGDNDAKEFLNALEAKRYEYKDRKYGEGEHLGFTVQDIERSRIGRSMVKDIGGVKHVDTWKALSAALAGLSNVNKRLSRLER